MQNSSKCVLTQKYYPLTEKQQIAMNRAHLDRSAQPASRTRFFSASRSELFRSVWLKPIPLLKAHTDSFQSDDTTQHVPRHGHFDRRVRRRIVFACHFNGFHKGLRQGSRYSSFSQFETLMNMWFEACASQSILSRQKSIARLIPDFVIHLTFIRNSSLVCPRRCCSDLKLLTILGISL